MTIQEQLNAINATFVKLHKDFVRFEAEKKSPCQQVLFGVFSRPAKMGSGA